MQSLVGDLAMHTQQELADFLHRFLKIAEEEIEKKHEHAGYLAKLLARAMSPEAKP